MLAAVPLEDDASLVDGHEKPAASKTFALLPPVYESRFDRTDLMRLMVQTLDDLGLSETSKMLRHESGIDLEDEWVRQLRQSVLEGDWQRAEITLNHVAKPDSLDNALFLIREQKYLEMLESGANMKALQTLRTELSPLHVDPTRVHKLTSLFLCNPPNDIYRQAEWQGAGCISRSNLLSQLQKHLLPRLMVAPHRLETLLEQSMKVQRQKCRFVGDDKEWSLLHDHSCDRCQFPNKCIHICRQHTDEVWFVAFSHRGAFMATGSKDKTSIIWRVSDWSVVHTLKGHEDPVSVVAWSPDDQSLLTGSNDHRVKLWSVATGSCRLTLTSHSDAITSCAWLPDGERFVTAAFDRNIYLWKTDGSCLYQWSGFRVTDLVISGDAERLICICQEKSIKTFSLLDRTELYSLQESDPITSLLLSKDSKYALVNLAAQEIHLWNLEKASVESKYVGHVQSRFVIRSCFGGSNQSFILSGSEDSKIYVWLRDQKETFTVLQGHTSTVNAVSWNPVHSSMFASASDDHTVRIWGLDPNNEVSDAIYHGRRRQSESAVPNNSDGGRLRRSHYSETESAEETFDDEDDVDEDDLENRLRHHAERLIRYSRRDQDDEDDTSGRDMGTRRSTDAALRRGVTLRREHSSLI